MTPTTESRESVEALAERIVSRYVGGAYFKGCARDCREKIEEWLRACGIDPATMKPIDTTVEELQQRKEQPTLPPEPEVSERDRESWYRRCGVEIAHHFEGDAFHDYTPGDVARIIGKYAANDRAERDTLRTQLAATEAKLRETEGRVRELEKVLGENERVFNVSLPAIEHEIRKLWDARHEAFVTRQPKPTETE